VASFQEEGELEKGRESLGRACTKEEVEPLPRLEAVHKGPPAPIKTEEPREAGMTIGEDGVSAEVRGEVMIGETEPELEVGEVAVEDVEEEQEKRNELSSKTCEAELRAALGEATEGSGGVEMLAW
jgi:hypothetical protein